MTELEISVVVTHRGFNAACVGCGELYHLVRQRRKQAVRDQETMRKEHHCMSGSASSTETKEKEKPAKAPTEAQIKRKADQKAKKEKREKIRADKKAKADKIKADNKTKREAKAKETAEDKAKAKTEREKVKARRKADREAKAAQPKLKRSDYKEPGDAGFQGSGGQPGKPMIHIRVKTSVLKSIDALAKREHKGKRQGSVEQIIDAGLAALKK